MIFSTHVVEFVIKLDHNRVTAVLESCRFGSKAMFLESHFCMVQYFLVSVVCSVGVRSVEKVERYFVSWILLLMRKVWASVVSGSLKRVREVLAHRTNNPW